MTTQRQEHQQAEAEQHVQQLADALEAALQVLHDLEWDADGDCPWCHDDEHRGHASDCGLATALQVGEAACAALLVRQGLTR